MTTAAPAAPATPRPTSLPDVPRWAVLAAHAVPLVALPSGLWRLLLVAGLPVAEEGVDSPWTAAYVVSLTVVSEALALLTLGLVRPWGESVPRWVPRLGGRRIPPLVAVVPALTGAFLLVALIAWFVYANATGIGQGTIGSPAQDLFLLACYLPLAAWPPLLIAVTLAYHRRRAAPAPGPAPAA
ncbi:hypothetical protein [Streptomyces sp. NPDC007369]|uniref:hypothetical protein n=1 Tax=Streptomyces sp. NPDC007369 TaxID=3154589 RepID=UPI0033CAA9CD